MLKDIIFFVICVIILLIGLASNWKLFKQKNEPGWASIVPIYGFVVMCRIAKLPLWYVAMLFVPFVSPIFMLIIYINFAKAYDKSAAFGVGMAYLPMIFFPIAAFGKESKTKVNKVRKLVYAILTLLLGTFGINKFYAKEIKSGLLRLLFCWTGIPTILSIAEFITVLTEKADKKGMIAATSKRRENVAFGVATALFTIFLIGTIIPWESLFEGFTAFTDFNTFLGNIKSGDYTVFSNIIGAPVVTSEYGSTGTIAAIGTWKMMDVAIFLFVVTIIIAIANKLSVNDTISSVTSGVKKILPVAITAMLISIVLVIFVTTGINITICKVILSITKEFNIVTATIASIICSVSTADFYYFVSAVGSVFAATIGNKDYYGVIAFMLQSLYNFTMILAPTSVGLVIGLYYLDIPYNKWFKFIWKTLLALFVIIVVTTIVIYVLV